MLIHFPTRMRQLEPLALVLASAAVAIAAYLQALNYPFISDDSIYITNNTKLAGLQLTDLWRLFTEPYNGWKEFLPLRDFSYWLDITLFGLNPAAFRVHNILLYLLCLPLVYATTSGIWRYFRPLDKSAPWVAAIVTALFAIHATHVEAIVWVSGRKDVLSGMLSLLALWLAVSAKREQGLSTPYAVATLVALLAAMLSKAVAVAVAPVIALLWLIFWRDIPASERHRSQLLWPLATFVLAACIALIFSSVIKTRIPVYFGIETVTRALAVLGCMARLSVSPESRHFIYPVFEDPKFPFMVALGALILMAAAAGIVIMLRKRAPEGFALIVFVLLCLPYLQLVPYTPPSLISDRFLFLAVWPFILLMVALVWRLNPAPRTALLLIMALLLSFQTAERPRDWRSREALINADFLANPWYYYVAGEKIMFVLWPQGLYNEASEVANGITNPEFRDITIKLSRAHYAVSSNSGSIDERREAMALLWNLGVALEKPPAQAKWDPSVIDIWKGYKNIILTNEWEALAKRFSEDVSVRYNAGLWLLSIDKFKDAIPHLRIAAESQRLPEPVRGTAFKNLGLALINSGHVAEAEIPLRAALEQSQPDMRAYCLLSEVYKQTKRLDEAGRADTNCPKPTPGKKTTQ